MFTNFFNNNKQTIRGASTGSLFNTAIGGFNDYRRNRKRTSNDRAINRGQAIDEEMVDGKLETTYRDRTNPFDFGMSRAPKTVRDSSMASDKVTEAETALNNYNSRADSAPDYDPMANAGGLSDKRTKQDDDEDGERTGPSPLERYMREVQEIQSGNFEYSGSEKTSINNLRRTGRQAELRQSRVNDNYEGGTLQGELRSGRSRYAQELSDDAMINAMQTGTDAINEVDLQTSKSVADLESSIKEKRLRQVAVNFGLLQEQDKQRNNIAQQLQSNIFEKQKLDAQLMNSRNNEKYRRDSLAFQRSNASANRANSLAIAGMRNQEPSINEGFFGNLNVTD